MNATEVDAYLCEACGHYYAAGGEAKHFHEFHMSTCLRWMCSACERLHDFEGEAEECCETDLREERILRRWEQDREERA